MGIIIMVLFIAIYIYQFNYIRKNGLSYNYLIVSLFLLIIQSVSILNNINIMSYETYINSNGNVAFFIGYFIGYLLLGIIALFINYIQIYKHDNNLEQEGLINHYVNILKTKKANCNRQDYWLFYIAILIFSFAMAVVFTLLGVDYDNILLIAFGIEIINWVLQAKRLNDIGITQYFLLIHLANFLGFSFGLVADIVMLAIMCLSSKEIPTTKIHNSYTKEN